MPKVQRVSYFQVSPSSVTVAFSEYSTFRLLLYSFLADVLAKALEVERFLLYTFGTEG